ncbi:PPE domain-containing protein [Actinophytocola oryzae]|nr:PPE domain-containing protein [Actinophytocola oryzae]
MLDFLLAHSQFGREVADLDELTSGWGILGEDPPPLGHNPVGMAVARRFVAMSGRFVATLHDYGGKLRDAQGAMGEVARSYAETDGNAAEIFRDFIGCHGGVPATAAGVGGFAAFLELSGLRTAGYPEDWAHEDWTPADKHDWRAYSSTQLHQFATEGNHPVRVFDSVGEWRSNMDSLRSSTANFAKNVGELMSAWQGPAATAANGALTPLVGWGEDAEGNADRLRTNLRKAAEAAEHLKRMPGPVAEPRMYDLLLGSLQGLPIDTTDLRAQKDHAAAVKAEQVRYMEQYESAMTTVYDDLPDFHLAPVAVADDPDPGVPGPENRPYPGRAADTSPASVPEQRDASGGDLPGDVAAARAGDGGTVASGATNPPGSATFTSTPNPATVASGPLHGGGGYTAGGAFGPRGTFGPGGSGPRAGEAGRVGEGRGGTTRGTTPGAVERPAGRHGVSGPSGRGGRPGDEEDVEHQRPAYLVERDPEGTFGTTERTAPPVIG